MSGCVLVSVWLLVTALAYGFLHLYSSHILFTNSWSITDADLLVLQGYGPLPTGSKCRSKGQSKASIKPVMFRKLSFPRLATVVYACTVVEERPLHKPRRLKSPVHYMYVLPFKCALGNGKGHWLIRFTGYITRCRRQCSH